MFLKKKNKPHNPTLSAEQQESEKRKSSNAQVMQMMQMGAGFEKTIVDSALSSAKNWRRFGVGALVVAGVACAAVMGLTPLKEAVPYVARVNETTGAVDIITSIKDKQMHYDEVVNKYWLAEYVRQRESYDWNTVQMSYDNTLLMSAPEVQIPFKNLYNSAAAPHKVLKNRFKVVAKVTNISFVGDVAQVRFEKQMMPITGETETTPSPPEKLIATVAFEFKATPMKEASRLINPLGFQVTSYRVDPEAAP